MRARELDELVARRRRRGRQPEQRLVDREELADAMLRLQERSEKRGTRFLVELRLAVEAWLNDQ